MTIMNQSLQRARSTQAKEQREAAILSAVTLFANGGIMLFANSGNAL
jgi:hypothetical protein